MSKPSTAAVALADAAVLVLLRPDLGELRRGLSAPRTWIADTGADLVVAGLVGAALWCVAAWVAIGLLAVLASHLPGATGRLAAGVATVALPAVLRRIVVGSAGLGVLLAPVAAQAQAVHDVPAPSAPSSVAAPSRPVPGPSWPASTSASPSPSPSPSPSASLPGPAWPRSSSPSPDRPGPTQTPTPTPHTRAPHPPAPPPPHTTAPTPAPPPTTPPTTQSNSRVTVRAGDCLWLLAAHRLGPSASDAELADYVPQLYAANRNVIGDDPDLVTPGQVLDVPPAG